ncbi:T9SS type A sorting domain-containing protein [Taibaiella koreensis]|uniref:T9SS type A sorting domain-containing protein n=1 Tax=Taibaiella koreensis TaxID=1268548 RepID=UPI000E5A05EE|nr:T9SS type A sorting domain-containing protein [Taibaiella koreensis]
MKILYPILSALGFSASVVPAQAQFYLGGLNNDNNAGIVSYYTDSAIVPPSGSYTAVNGAMTIHGGKHLHIDGPYTAGSGSIDSLVGDGSASWPPTDAIKTISGSIAPTLAIAAFTNGVGQAVDITNTNGVNIATSLYFGNGLTTTVRSNSNTGALRFLDNAVYTNASSGDAQYVNGYVSKIGNDAFTFPVGSQAGNDLRTLQISAPGTATDHISIAYWSGDASSGMDPTSTGTQSLTALNPTGTAGVDRLFSVSPLCFWDWIAISGTSSLSITVSLPGFSGNGGYTNAANMRLTGWNTNTLQWDNLSGNTGASGLAEGSTLSGTVPDISLYSAIAIGNVQEVPLPVNITSFTGNMDNSCNARLTWETARELNVAEFAIQYSADGRQFTNAGTVAPGHSGTGTYTLTLSDIPHGKAFFRLMVKDRDGSIAYDSRVLQLQSNCEGAAAIALWPNPAKDAVTVSGMYGRHTIAVLDINGRPLRTVVTDNSREQIDIRHLSDGTYLLRITNNSNNEVIYRKMVKQQ